MRKINPPKNNNIENGIERSIILSNGWVNKQQLIIQDDATVVEIVYHSISENPMMGLPYNTKLVSIVVNDEEIPSFTQNRLITVENICGNIVPVLYSDTRRVQSLITGNPDYPEVALSYDDFIDVISEKMSLDNAVERAKERRK